MVIRFKESFVRRLEIQIAFIALDSPLRAAKFKQDLFDKIKRIPANPHAFRKSRYFDDENIRDLVFKGYCIVFRINQKSMEVFGLLKFQNRL